MHHGSRYSNPCRVAMRICLAEGFLLKRGHVWVIPYYCVGIRASLIPKRNNIRFLRTFIHFLVECFRWIFRKFYKWSRAKAKKSKHTQTSVYIYPIFNWRCKVSVLFYTQENQGVEFVSRLQCRLCIYTWSPTNLNAIRKYFWFLALLESCGSGKDTWVPKQKKINTVLLDPGK